MESGFEFEGAGASETISDSYSFSLTTATESTYSMQEGAKISVTCSESDGSQIGLW